MCLFICANSNAQDWLAATVDHGYRQALQICVWHPTEKHKLNDAGYEEHQWARRVPRRLGIHSGIPLEWQLLVRAAARARHTISAGYDSPAEKAPNLFTEAWSVVWRWIRRGR
jgi:hypothetical protein